MRGFLLAGSYYTTAVRSPTRSLLISDLVNQGICLQGPQAQALVQIKLRREIPTGVLDDDDECEGVPYI